MKDDMFTRRGLCWPGRHNWQKRVVVPGKYCSITVDVCEHCGKGAGAYREARRHYAAYLTTGAKP